MTIAIGDRLPDATFKEKTADGVVDLTTEQLFKGKRVVLFAVPGAFTPTCSLNHLPGYLENRDAILARGVDDIAVVAVNDVHVMGAWAQHSGGMGKIHFLADGNATFTKAIGLDIDLSAGGLGTRSKRYSMLVEDGVVKSLSIEDAPGQATVSAAAAMLEQLSK
jgi:Peroxiredoxin